MLWFGTIRQFGHAQHTPGKYFILLHCLVPSVPPKSTRMEPPATEPPSEPQCAICISSRLTQPTRCEPCGHTFCYPCISEWAFKMTSTCPLCQQKIETLHRTTRIPVPALERRQQEMSRELIMPAGMGQDEEDEPDSFVSVDEGMVEDAMGDMEYRTGRREDDEEDEDEDEDSMDCSSEDDTDDELAQYDFHPEMTIVVGSCRSRRAALDFSMGRMDEQCAQCLKGGPCNDDDLAGWFFLRTAIQLYAPITLLQWSKFCGTINSVLDKTAEVHALLVQKTKDKLALSDEFLANGYITRALLNQCEKEHPFVFVQIRSKTPPLPGQ